LTLAYRAGASVLAALKESGLDTSCIRQLSHEYHSSNRTAQYVAVNDADKNLVIAMADMAIFTSHTFPDYWKSAVAATKPKWLVVDGNWSAKDIRAWIEAGKSNESQVAFEPVSTAKSTRLFSLGEHSHLEVFPRAGIALATPNHYELAAMHSAAQANGYFESDEWFQVIDAFGMMGARDRFEKLTSAEMTDAGIPVQTIQLLPYIPTIITKLGRKGCLLTQILSRDDPRLRDRDAAKFLLTRSLNDHPHVGGVYMRLFPAVEKVEDVVSVNGVGDTFLGVLVTGMAKGGRVERLIDVAQRGAVMTLRSSQAVSPDLGRLEEELNAAAD
jgi:pseudouridylate synthase / pseudouridine kinase